jgi:hypothetical protein
MSAISLADFLREQAAKHQAAAVENKALIQDWLYAIDALFVQVKAWLKESDPNGIVEVQ